MIDRLVRQDLDFTGVDNPGVRPGIHLNANELPWENRCDKTGIVLNRYPKDKAMDLLADFYKTSSENILLTAGSSAGIELVIKLFCLGGKDTMLICPPTFSMYEFYGKLLSINVVEVPRKMPDNFALDLDAICQYDNAKLIFICSPNNPTGNSIAEETIRYLCRELRAMIVVDEAYIEFSSETSMISLVEEFENLIVLRTFSKAFGLAALRLGAIIANPRVVGYLKQIQAPYTISSYSLKLLEELNFEKISLIRRFIEKEKAFLEEALKQSSLITKVWPSEANFLLVQIKSQALQQLKAKGIFVRDVSDYWCLDNCLRITIGTREENKQLVACLTTGGEKQ